MDSDAHSLEHDFSLLDRYLAYSSELLRLALLGIAGIGYLLTQEAFKERARAEKTLLVAALIAFLVSSLCALIHRYVGPDAMRVVVALKRGSRSATERERDRRFAASDYTLGASAFCLFAGAACAVVSFIRIF